MKLALYVVLILAGIWLFTKLFFVIWRFTVYVILAIPIWIGLFVFASDMIAGYALLIALLILAIYRGYKAKKENSYIRTYSEEEIPDKYKPFVFNIRSNIIHDKYSKAADEIEPWNRVYVTSRKANELVNKHKKVRFNKELDK